MKKKYFLRGLGVGILLTTLILCIGYRQYNSEETVVKRAKKIGMEFPKKTPDTLLTTSGAAASASFTPSVEPIPAVTSKATPVQSSEPEETERKTPKPSSNEGEKTSKDRTFTVRGGLLSSSVARELRQAGIIKDSDAFDKYLEKSGLARKIVAGKYKIPEGSDYQQIAKIITKQD